jgi:hypothetical protein
MGFGTIWKRRTSFILLLLGGGISLLWGFALERGVPGGVMGFPGIYYGTKCLIHSCDPYNVTELEDLYKAEGYGTQPESLARRQAVILYVNVPTTFLFIAPFTILPLGTAQVLWQFLIVGSFISAACLMWSLGADYAPNVSLLLTFLVLANSEVIFAGGNTAGIVVGLGVIAVWCILRERFVPAGITCLAVSLAIKPHDIGLIWLYFLLAGGVYRKRALQAAALAASLTLLAVLWVSHVAPHWLPELRSNLAAISAPGGINEPGPRSIGVNSPDMIIDFQTVISIFEDNPQIYNWLTYFVCGVLLLTWAVTILRSRFSPKKAWFALVSVVALSMLVTYHRSYDAKLLLLSVPACAALWAEGGAIGWIALAVTAAGIFFTGDIPLAILMQLTRNLDASAASMMGKVPILLLTRPAPLILLVIAIFYLWIYKGYSTSTSSKSEGDGIEQVQILPASSDPA